MIPAGLVRIVCTALICATVLVALVILKHG